MTLPFFSDRLLSSLCPFQATMEPRDNNIPFSSYLELLGENPNSQPCQSGSQETHSSSQGFVSGLANDEELFGGIKADEDFPEIFESSAVDNTPLQIPLSPVSTVSVESVDTIVDLIDNREVTSKDVYTSLVKQEVKYKVQLNQMKHGIDPDAADYHWKKCEVPVEMSEESLRRIEERKRKNRIAAQKCRNKKRRSEEDLKEKHDRLEKENEDMRRKIASMRQECQKINSFILHHHCVKPCDRPISPDLSSY